MVIENNYCRLSPIFGSLGFLVIFIIFVFRAPDDLLVVVFFGLCDLIISPSINKA